MLKQIKFFLILGLTTMLFSGCDMFNAVKEYFSKSKKPAALETTSPSSESSEISNTTSQETGPLPENVIARVGKWSITADQFNDRLKAIKEVVPDFDPNDPKNKELVLQELVRQQLLVEDAEAQGLDKKKDIQEAMEEFRRTVLVREIATKLTENVEVSDAEANAFYEQNKAAIMEPPQLHVREIKTDTEEKAKAILVDLLQGKDFAETAKQNSTAPSAASGGDLGILKQLPFPEMGAPLQALEVGKVSSVFKGPDGFYIIKLEEKKEGQQLPYEKVKTDIIQNRKLAKQQQIILDYISQLEKKYKVETNKDLLGGGK
jgi:peptidyl-prolyl cis-trans isomerase C